MKTHMKFALPVALVAGAVSAQTMNTEYDETEHLRARDLVANAIYSTGTYVENDWDVDAEVEDIESDYRQIGEVEDILLDRKGQMVGIVAEVGGFLDIGDKHVVVETNDLRVVMSGDEPHFVTRLTEEELEEFNGVDEGYFN